MPMAGAYELEECQNVTFNEKAKSMKIILDKDGVRRSIEAPFAICIGYKDALRLQEILKEKFGDGEGVKGNMNYGWIEIHPNLELTINSPPKNWTD